MRALHINKIHLILTGLFIFYILMAIFTPLTHDDWDWYSQYGIQMLQEHFANLNGRYLGNLFEIVAVRFDWFRWLAYAVFSMLIIWVISQFVKHKQTSIICLAAFILMVTMPNEIYKQTYGWFAGFYNYVPATLCVLFILWFIVTVLFYRNSHKPSTNIIFYCVCFGGQFFIENATLFNTLIIAIALVLHIYFYKKVHPKFVVGWFISALGTIIMFLNPNYRKIFFEGSDYQQVSSDTGIIDKVYKTVTTILPDWIFFNQIVIITIIVGILLVMLYKTRQTTKTYTSRYWFIVCGLTLLPIYYFIIFKQFELQHFHMITLTNILNTMVCFIFLCALILAIHTVISQKEVRYTLYLLIASILLVCGPLIIVSPIGPRNFYTVYAIYVVILLILLAQLEVFNRKSEKWITGLAIFCAVMYLGVFYNIHAANEARISQLKEAVHADSKQRIYSMEKLPFEHYLHHATPTSAKYQTLFNEYEGLPKDTKVKYVPYGSISNQKQSK